ncbi:hypothetical protein Tco_1000984 [Tanacetum coccineum]
MFPSPEPSVSCIDDLDFFKDFENEFPAIVYNDALTSKSDFSTKPTLCPQHIDDSDLKNETSLSEYDEVEQNVLYFVDLFPFNIIYPDDLKSDKNDDDNEIDMIQSLGNLYVPFGILFDPKRYYKDGDCTRILRRPRSILAQYLFRHAEGRKSGVRLLGGHFIRRLARHFGLVSDDGLRGLSVVTCELPLIDMGELAVPAPIHAPPPPPPAAARTMPQRLGRLEEEVQGLCQDVRSLRGLVERSMTDQGRFSTWMVSCMMQLKEASGPISGGRATPEKEAINAKGRKSGARLSKGHFIGRLAHHLFYE